MLTTAPPDVPEHRRHWTGMKNVVVLSGTIRSMDAWGGWLRLSSRALDPTAEFPFSLRRRDSLPRWVMEGTQVKLMGRLEGTTHPQSGKPSCILRVLRFTPFEVVSPRSRWQSAHFNDVSLVGLVAQKQLVRVHADSTQPGQAQGDNSCLHVLLQQSSNQRLAGC